MPDTIKLQILPTGTMHADLTRLLLDPAQPSVTTVESDQWPPWLSLPTGPG